MGHIMAMAAKRIFWQPCQTQLHGKRQRRLACQHAHFTCEEWVASAKLRPLGVLTTRHGGGGRPPLALLCTLPEEVAGRLPDCRRSLAPPIAV